MRILWESYLGGLASFLVVCGTNFYALRCPNVLLRANFLWSKATKYYKDRKRKISSIFLYIQYTTLIRDRVEFHESWKVNRHFLKGLTQRQTLRKASSLPPPTPPPLVFYRVTVDSKSLQRFILRNFFFFLSKNRIGSSQYYHDWGLVSKEARKWIPMETKYFLLFLSQLSWKLDLRLFRVFSKCTGQ